MIASPVHNTKLVLLKVRMPFWKRLMENFGKFADGGCMLTLDGNKKKQKIQTYISHSMKKS